MPRSTEQHQSNNKSFTLNYFNKWDKSELCKLIFEYADVKYTDKWISNLTGSGPFLEIKWCKSSQVQDKCKIPLVSCICRYLAREFGLAGKNNEDQVKADAIATECMMLIDRFYNNVFNVENTDQKKINLKVYKETDCENVASEVENLIKMWNCDEIGHFGRYVTYSDLFVYEMVANYLPKNVEFTKRFPNLERVAKSVERDPKLATFFGKRKQLACERSDLLNIN